MFLHISHSVTVVQSLESAWTAVCLIRPFRFLLRITDVSFMFVPGQWQQLRRGVVQWGMYSGRYAGKLSDPQSRGGEPYCICGTTPSSTTLQALKSEECVYWVQSEECVLSTISMLTAPPSRAPPIRGSQIQIASSRDTKVQNLAGLAVCVCKGTTAQHSRETNSFIPLLQKKGPC